ncbi:helix-turn-helix domain-containing protein [Streptomyces avermitilis]|uniref:helix-turn-helix domain-containing protein n=1 Tax=Streptomyces avermitilis TaxID=33903 RepID=UPI003F4D6D73
MSEEELAEFETDVLSGFVLARASAGLVDSTIRNDTHHLELIRDWFGRPLWEMEPADADVYFGKVLRDAKPSTRTGQAAALAVLFQFLELRHKVELHNLTGRVAECPLDEMNRPRASVEPQLRIPPSEAEVEALFAGWREEPVTCRKFGPAARNYAVAPLAADVGLRINEARRLDLDDVRWELAVYPRPRHPCRRRLGRRTAARHRPMEWTGPVKWNLRLTAANRGIWKASELQRMLAERGVVISAGKMSGLWSGQPNTVKLDELDVVCAVLGCGIEELLLPELERVPEPVPATDSQATAVGQPRAVAPRPLTCRSLPPR